MDYNPKEIEPKWQKRWEEKRAFEARDDSLKPKFYGLIEFPYPSGDGLHVGHVRSNTAMDIIARKRRAEGYEVLYPIGWDAFGLPTENYAIKTGKKPVVVTKENTDIFRRQLQALGFSFDWSREINTTDPAYYKWTQWIFLQFYKAGLAYKAKQEINWCPKDKIGLANEEVINGECERCGTKVEKREKEQWMLAITKYADRLEKDLETVDYLDKIKAQQRNWIGRSEGAEISFLLTFQYDTKANDNRGPNGERAALSVFTTRPDTLFGATYMVLAPEHLWVMLATDDNHHVLENKEEVRAYVQAAKGRTDIERTALEREKTGVELKGVKAINPATGEEIPIWVADYVLAQYGTGAVMAVPAHDERDWAFALKYGLPTKEVVVPNIIDRRNPPVAGKKTVERKNVHAIVRNPRTGKYLALKWKKFDWTTFPMGGREEGESVEAACRREVLEETGFKNLALVRVLPGTVRAEYFATHKDENRVAFTNAALFDLVDDEQVPVSKEESEAHDSVWIDETELNYEHMTHAEVGEWQRQLQASNGAYTGEGVLIASGDFSGSSSEEAQQKITEAVGGKWVVKYKLRDWVFSRQRYWGEPIPMVYCAACAERTPQSDDVRSTMYDQRTRGWVPVPEKDLPVTLPDVENYQPTDTGESPLAAIESWVKTECPACGGAARRETDTMPNWAGSSWYFLRYLDPKNSKQFASEKVQKRWLPVDWYNGGMEHTTLHLLYSRFWHKFLFDQGFVPTSEPYAKRTSHGLILAEGGVKMSKSKGNVINPDAIVEQFGADALRLYEMFMGPFEQAIAWSTDGLVGARRFLERVWKIAEKVDEHAEATHELSVLTNQTIEKVSHDIEELKMNTAVSALMILARELEHLDTVPLFPFETLLALLAPFAPHLAEELWEKIGHAESLSSIPWPSADASQLELDTVKIGIQINGKVRDSMSISRKASEAEVKEAALAREAVKKWLEGKSPKKVVYVKGRLISIVV